MSRTIESLVSADMMARLSPADREAVRWDLLMLGCMFVEVVRGPSGDVLGVVRIHPAEVRIVDGKPERRP